MRMTPVLRFFAGMLVCAAGWVLASWPVPVLAAGGPAPGGAVAAVPAVSPVVSDAMSGEEAALVAQAESGDARAKMMLGLRYAMGRGVAADDAKAQKWLREAAMAGNAVAQVSLATMMAFESDEQDTRGALIWYGKAAAQGNTQAQAELARLLEAGLGVTRNPEEAEAWRRQAREQADEVMVAWAWRIAATGSENWQVAAREFRQTPPEGVATGIDTIDRTGIAVDVKAVGRDVERGDPVAKTVGAFLLATGNGLEKDESLALVWLREAAEAGHMHAQAALGELVMLGWGPLKEDREEAARWMKRAAMQGLREAKTSYGAMLAGGKGVKENKKEAFGWIGSAARENEPRAQLMMAMNALAKEDREGAAQWFYRAAENGDDEVLSMLGVLYGWGDAAVAGESEKLTEVRRYAQRGEPEAQLMLGLLFQEGWGTARDAVSAERWFSAAASQHYDDVWLPLGLFYAETGRVGEARAAFDAAVRLNAYSFARDTGILQLVFIESEKMPELEDSQLPDETKPLSGEEAKEEPVAPDGPENRSADGAFLREVPLLADDAASGHTVQDKAALDGVMPDLRRERIAKKIAFLKEEVERGNPAAEMMLAVLLEKGWSVPPDGEAADRLRALARGKICKALGDAAENEPDCVSPDTGGGEPDEPSDGTAGEAVPEDGDSLAMRVTDYSTGGGL